MQALALLCRQFQSPEICFSSSDWRRTLVEHRLTALSQFFSLFVHVICKLVGLVTDCKVVHAASVAAEPTACPTDAGAAKAKPVCYPGRTDKTRPSTKATRTLKRTIG
jgi:hypothetical protein